MCVCLFSCPSACNISRKSERTQIWLWLNSYKSKRSLDAFLRAEVTGSVTSSQGSPIQTHNHVRESRGIPLYDAIWQSPDTPTTQRPLAPENSDLTSAVRKCKISMKAIQLLRYTHISKFFFATAMFDNNLLHFTLWTGSHAGRQLYSLDYKLSKGRRLEWGMSCVNQGVREGEGSYTSSLYSRGKSAPTNASVHWQQLGNIRKHIRNKTTFKCNLFTSGHSSVLETFGFIHLLRHNFFLSF
jgi:hypothetical protein